MGKMSDSALSPGSCYLHIQRFFGDRNIRRLQN